MSTHWTAEDAQSTVGVAAFGLDTTRCLPTTPLDADAWAHTLALIAEQRLVGLLAQAVATGGFAVDAEQAAVVHAFHEHDVLRALRLESLVISVVDLLSEAEIPSRVLKGSAIAHTAYADPSLRSFCDVDVLVPGDSFDAAVVAISATGARRRYAQPRPGFDRRFSKGASFLTSTGLAIDLHRTFVLGPFGLTIDLPAVFEQRRQFALAGRLLDTLPAEETFVHVCLHTALGDWPPRLVPMRDVAQMLTTPSLDLDRVRELATTWRVNAPLAWSIDYVWRTFALPPHPLVAWAQSYQPTAAERRRLALYMSPHRSYPRMALASTRVVPGITAKLAYLRALAMPERDYVLARERNYVARWRHAAHVAAGRNRGAADGHP